MLHPGDDSPHIQAVIDKTMNTAWQQEALFRQWKASDSTDSFNDWAREQKTLDHNAHMKLEETDAGLSARIKLEDAIVRLPAKGSAGDMAMKEFGFTTVTWGERPFMNY
jgi:hypothetical protein